jgi:enoyl-CoA hydratase/carnithine racemase
MAEDTYPAAQPTTRFDFQTILYHKADGRATVTINRPDVYNAFDFQTLREMSRAFEDASWDDEVGVVVLTGAGDKAFCTGADLREQRQFTFGRPDDYWKWMGAFIEAHDRLRGIGKPTIARLNGMTVGGGNEFNMACDLAVAADDIFIRQVGISRGSVPAGGATQWLPLLVGDRRAREILWLCEEIPAAKALEWGLVNRVVPRAQLDAAVDELVAALLQKLPEIFRYAKQQTNFWKDLAWHATVGHARDWLTAHAAAAETQEGLRAFFDKRPVDYRGIRSGAVTATTPAAEAQACPHCGAADLPHGFAYCGRCGEKL